MKKLLATLLILCAGPVWAEWVLYDNSSDGNAQFFYNPSTVKGGDIKRAWHKIELKKPAKGSEGNALSFRYYTEFDCVDEKIRALQFEAFSETNLAGKTLSKLSEKTNWEYVPPNTGLETLLNKVCVHGESGTESRR